MNGSVKILYFSWLREMVGLRDETLELPEGVDTVGALLSHLSRRGQGFETAFQKQKTIRCAVNQEFADFSHPVSGGDEIGFFPPVTGG